MQEENARKEAVESQLRKERAKQKLEEIKQREMDEATPKARSALAARWEEKIKTRGGGGKISTTENKTTVMSDVSLTWNCNLVAPYYPPYFPAQPGWRDGCVHSNCSWLTSD